MDPKDLNQVINQINTSQEELVAKGQKNPDFYLENKKPKAEKGEGEPEKDPKEETPTPEEITTPAEETAPDAPADDTATDSSEEKPEKNLVRLPDGNFLDLNDPKEKRIHDKEEYIQKLLKEKEEVLGELNKVKQTAEEAVLSKSEYNFSYHPDDFKMNQKDIDDHFSAQKDQLRKKHEDDPDALARETMTIDMEKLNFENQQRTFLQEKRHQEQIKGLQAKVQHGERTTIKSLLQKSYKDFPAYDTEIESELTANPEKYKAMSLTESFEMVYSILSKRDPKKGIAFIKQLGGDSKAKANEGQPSQTNVDKGSVATSHAGGPKPKGKTQQDKQNQELTELLKGIPAASHLFDNS